MRRRVPVLRLVTAAASVVVALVLAGPAAAERYVVVYKQVKKTEAATVKADVEWAGGSLVAAYAEIGVAVAESSSPTFASAMRSLSTVEGVAASRGFGTSTGSTGWPWSLGPGFPNVPAADADTFSPLQWWSKRIRGPEAHKLSGGSPDVVLGVIDSGADANHPDLAPNIDYSRSVSCVTGAPNTDPVAWNDDSGHGSNVAGVATAASNGVGVVGIAPNVDLAVIKASVPRGSVDVFSPEAVICSFMWAATNGVDVANNSYSVDSAYFGGTTSFCRDDEEQKTVIRAVKRAVDFAIGTGVTVVASAGNNGLDLGDPALANCFRLPSELPGVLTVSSIGLDDRLAVGPPSNFGLGVVTVAAGGGDFLQGAPPAGLVLGPWPAAFQVPRLLCDPCEGPGAAYYAFFAGTSQAAAQVSGVAALVVSRFGRVHTNGDWKMVPKRVVEVVRETADPLPCPANDARCVTSGEQTSFFGHGVVNAYRAAINDRVDPFAPEP